MYKPKKQLGQNFLADKKVIEKIIIESGIKPDDIVLEIGPGQGSLTYALSQKVKKVIAVEKDEKLYDYLLKKFNNIKNIEFINKDILKYLKNLEINKLKKYKVVANIPYYLTSYLIRELLALEKKPTEIILMVQKEVAERIIAKAGEMNVLAISVQLLANPEILFYVSKNSFWPKPKVDSAVIKIMIKNQELKINNFNEDLFFKIVHTGFAAKRKLLINNLVKGLDIPKEKIYGIFEVLGISLNARAQDLSINDWICVYNKLNSKIKNQKSKLQFKIQK